MTPTKLAISPSSDATLPSKAQHIHGFRDLEATILFADLRGFSAIFSEHSSGVVIEMLNRFLSTMSEVVLKHQGTVDKFIGDSVMATFGTPEPHADDLSRALSCAIEMQLAMDNINAFNARLKLPAIYMGIGINTGKVVAGSFGSALRSEYTVIGDCVNLASRIESFSLRGQILIGEESYKQAADYIKVSTPVDIFVKGKPAPISVYELLAIPDYELYVPRREARRSPRVKVHMPFNYQKIDRKIVSDVHAQGTIIDMSYYGLQVAFNEPVRASEEVKISMDLSLVASVVDDIYGKVLKTTEQDGCTYAAIEFTSVSAQNELYIRHFVQLMMQGCENLSY